ncbi:MAG TPA: type II CAAX endopeptidase family protein [Chloroflexota bacterium]
MTIAPAEVGPHTWNVPWGVGRAVVVVAVVWLLFAQVVGGVTVTVAALTLFHYPAGLSRRDVLSYVFNHYPIEINMIAYQFLLLGLILVGFWLIVSRFGVGLKVIGWRPVSSRTLVLAAASAIPILIAATLVFALFNALFPGLHIQGNERDLFGSPQHISDAERVVMFVLAAIEAPLVEETLFRGILYQGLRRYFTGRLRDQWAVAAAAVTSGALFALIHLEPHTLPMLLILGVALAYVFERANSLYASALVHCIINALGVITYLSK